MSVKQDTSLRKLISVVIPIFNEEDGIEQLRERLSNLRATWENVELEFIFVDDGSSDQTVKGLRASALPSVPGLPVAVALWFAPSTRIAPMVRKI